MSVTKHILDAAVRQYIETALFATTDHDSDTPLDKHYSQSDLAEGEYDAIQDEVTAFLAVPEVAALAEHWYLEDYTQAAHDFFLTRNGHGAGFRDGHWPDNAGQVLYKAANGKGSHEPYVGDDGMVYFA